MPKITTKMKWTWRSKSDRNSWNGITNEYALKLFSDYSHSPKRKKRIPKTPKYPIGFEFEVRRSCMKKLEGWWYTLDYEEPQTYQIIGYTYTKRGHIKYRSKRVDIEWMFAYYSTRQEIDWYVSAEKFRKECYNRINHIYN